MEKWLRFQLDGGVVHGKRLLSEKALHAMRSIHFAMPIPQSPAAFPAAHILGYGFGWFLHDYHGVMIVEHGGNIDGMTALVAMIPERKIGLVILSNMQGSRIREALMYHVFDLLLSRVPSDWNAHFAALAEKHEQVLKKVHQERLVRRRAGTSRSLALSAYAGRYRNPMYGELRIDSTAGNWA